MERILLAVDGSEHSARAASFAGELSRSTGAGVIVLHVVPERLLVSSEFDLEEYARIERIYLSEREILKAAGKRFLDEASARVRGSGGKVEGDEVVLGHPAGEIVSAANRLDCDCIVMGRRGLGNMGGLFMGSVSHKVGHLTDKTLITTE